MRLHSLGGTGRGQRSHLSFTECVTGELSFFFPFFFNKMRCPRGKSAARSSPTWVCLGRKPTASYFLKGKKKIIIIEPSQKYQAVHSCEKARESWVAAGQCCSSKQADHPPFITFYLLKQNWPTGIKLCPIHIHTYIYECRVINDCVSIEPQSPYRFFFGGWATEFIRRGEI